MTIPVIIVLGGTGAGKSALAVALAQAVGAEVISADAMALYRDMNIGTAKPSVAEQGGIAHHCLDCVAVDSPCDITRWLAMADAATAAIHGRGRRVIVAGGSPLYIKAYLEGLSTGAPGDPAVRAQWQQRYESEGGERLLAELRDIDPDYAAQRHPNDRRRIIRALEVHQITGRPFSSFHVTDGHRRDCYRTLLLGLAWPREELHRRINARVKAMFAAGLIDEVASLRDRLGDQARQAVGYKEVIAHLDGRYDREEAIYRVARATRLLAKQQRTWFKRFTDIIWLDGAGDDLTPRAQTLAEDFLKTGSH